MGRFKKCNKLNLQCKSANFKIMFFFVKLLEDYFYFNYISIVVCNPLKCLMSYEDKLK